jgi:subfamily B ATP-binding cassette protein HlyB/CyaB
MLTVKAEVAEPLMQRKWADSLGAYVEMAFRTRSLVAFSQFVGQGISKFTVVAILYFGAKAAIAGDITMGELLAFNMIAALVEGPIVRLASLWQDLQQIRVSIERLGDILTVTPETGLDSARKPDPIRGSISFRQVVFRYSDAFPALNNISFDIAAGEIVGIIGPSGSGKSTLAKIMQGLYRPQAGQILIDDIDIKTINTAWIRQHIGVVLQESILFNRSVHDNIALSDPEITRDRVRAAARQAGADTFISQMPEGYDTHIVERGANLSHGQRQRLAIARVLARSPRILILDEATSGVDYETEIVILDNLRAMAEGRTVIIVAHRLSSVRDCQRIIGIEKGEMVEDGTPEMLLRSAGSLYSKMWHLQRNLGAV